MSTQDSSNVVPEHLLALLKEHWGYDQLRPHQVGPVLDLAAGRNTLALLPTGGGKSVCFQLPALARGGLCLVVTPLVALMEDQCQTLRKMGLRAEAWVGSDGDRILDNVRFGPAQFLYLSPERLDHPMFLARLENWKVTTVVVDEVHCISQWGHDFRPAFQKIGSLKSAFPKAVWGAFTATATTEVLDDIATQLPLNFEVHRASMRRANLRYEVALWGDRDAVLLHDAARQQGQGLVYVQSRHESERWAQRLEQAGLRAAAFHAGLPAQEKQKRQRRWLDGKIQVLACTSAFGMGIDAPHVRWVFHAGPPPNLESYIQEAGRAGRDGMDSSCILYAEQKDFEVLRQRLDRQFPDKKQVQEAYQWAANASQAALGELPSDPVLVEKKEHLSALKLLALNGYFRLEEPPRLFEPKGQVRGLGTVPSGNVQARDLALAEWVARKAPHRLLEVNLAHLSAELRELHPHDKWDRDAVQMSLERLDAMGILDWHPHAELPRLWWLQPRMATKNVAVPRGRHALLKDKLGMVEAYVKVEAPTCRSQLLEAIFGDESHGPCGQCDMCQADRKEWRKALSLALDQGHVEVDSALLSFRPGHRKGVRELLANWYRSGDIVADQHRIAWSDRARRG